MAKIHNINLNLPFEGLAGLMHSIKDGLQELEQLKDCKDKDDLEKKLKDLESGFETRLKDGLSAFFDPFCACAFDPSVATNGRNNGIDVKQDDSGWLLCAKLPGVSADQCAVTVEEDGEQARLKMYVQGRLIANYVKPTRLVDAASVRASCIDGMLRVAVPKVAPTDHLIPVGSGDADVGEATLTLHVPGYAAADISLSLRLPERRLFVEGSNQRMGHFRSRALDISAAIEGGVDNISASCHNGVLTVRVAPTGNAAPRMVPVNDVADEADDDAAEVRKVILEKAVPGMGAADFTVEVDPASQCVKATAGSGAGRRLMLVNSLPRGVDAATVRASCIDGLLRITATLPSAVPAKREVAVSCEEEAAFVRGGGQA